MLRVKKCFTSFVLLFLAVLMFITMASSAYAASEDSRTIKSVVINITSNIVPGTLVGEEEINIEAKNGQYYYTFYTTQKEEKEWSDKDVPVITVCLQAEDDFEFAKLTADDVNIEGGTVKKVTQDNSKEMLVLEIELPSAKEGVAEPEDVILTDSGYVYWKKPTGAGTYDLRVYRNGDMLNTLELNIDKTEYNLKNYMDRAGDYQVKVRACNSVNPANKSKWVDSDKVSIDSDRAREIQAGLDLEKEMKGSWVDDKNGRKFQYDDEDKTLAKGWWKIDDIWYYFNDKGYMQTGWIEDDGLEYYMDDETGQLLTNTTTPDGYIVDENGNKKNSRK